MKNMWLGLGMMCLSIGCTTKQWYDAGEKARCDEYYRKEDPLYQTECKKETYDEYERKRKAQDKKEGK